MFIDTQVAKFRPKNHRFLYIPLFFFSIVCIDPGPPSSQSLLTFPMLVLNKNYILWLKHRYKSKRFDKNSI